MFELLDELLLEILLCILVRVQTNQPWLDVNILVLWVMHKLPKPQVPQIEIPAQFVDLGHWLQIRGVLL